MLTNFHLDSHSKNSQNQFVSRRVGQLTFDDCRQRAGRGGPRPGAGRPPGPRPRVHHVRRPEFSPRHPAHVTLRLRSGLPSLRRRRFLRQLQPSLRRLREREDFRLVHYSVQRDHLHLIVEADSRWAFGRGMRALGQRVAHAVNRACRRRGPVLDGRYHLRVLSTPRQVRNALAYVLLNARKHGWGRGRRVGPARLDEASSGRWFDGWSRSPAGSAATGPPETSIPRTWLLRTGWLRHGRIDPSEVPGRRRAAS